MTFKINKPFSDSDLSMEQKIKEQSFLRGADSHEIKKIDPNDKNDFREVRFCLNEYQAGIVDELAEKQDRKKIAILKEAIKKGLKEMISQ